MALTPLGRRAAAKPDPDSELLTRLRAGEEEAFLTLVERHHDTMLRLARSFVRSAAVAEEVVQETWLAVLRGIDGFAGRSSVRTWILAILVNRARSIAVREQRSIAVGDTGPVVDASRFDASGAWMSPPVHWVEESDDRITAAAMSGQIHRALDELSPHQRDVVLLRDVEGLSTQEVCEVLEISEGNQRVLLHRGRSHLRQALEASLGRV
jgi:RNA polymerase sigma-70 factor (ECF subfamily)